MNKTKFNIIYGAWIKSSNPTLLNLFWMLYDTVMYQTEWTRSDTKLNDHFHREGKDGDEYYKLETINTIKTWKNLVSNPDTVEIYDVDDNHFIFFDDFIISNEYGLELYTKDKKVPQKFWDSIVYTEEVPTIKICSSLTQTGLLLLDSEIKKVNKSDIEGHYNDDLEPVMTKIENFIEDPNDSGLVILHGIPGTGKTYLIRYLINEYPKKDFIFVDINDFYSLCSSKQNLGKFKDSILVIEDCEPLIKDREKSQFSQNISDLLNITDGLLGDTLNIKIICTFNVAISEIDQALLRKGRIKIKYEFKELTEDKAKALCEKLNVKYDPNNRILCDIFNSDTIGVDNNITKLNKPNKIGF